MVLCFTMLQKLEYVPLRNKTTVLYKHRFLQLIKNLIMSIYNIDQLYLNLIHKNLLDCQLNLGSLRWFRMEINIVLAIFRVNNL